MLRKLFAFALPLAALAIVPAIAVAQNAVVSQFYGNGVHAFFSGNMSRANEELTTAINSGSKDPRAFYFRGLTQMKMGYRDAAIADFQQGARLETADASRNYPVSKSLERVQGSDRLALERYRAVARASSVARQEQRMQARYEALRRNEADKLRRVAAPRATQPAIAIDPRPSGTLVLPSERTQPAAATAPAGGDDPFAAPAAPTDTPEEVLGGAAVSDPANPFGDAAVEGAAEPAGTPAVAPAEGAAEDLFGGGAEPAATEPAATEPATTEPAGTEPAAGDATDPFADDPAMTEGAATEGAATEEMPAAEATPGTTEVAPAAGETPAMEEAAADDPFAE